MPRKKFPCQNFIFIFEEHYQTETATIFIFFIFPDFFFFNKLIKLMGNPQLPKIPSTVTKLIKENS